MIHITYIMMTILVAINMISSLVLLLGVKHRNRFLLLPWIVWTGLTIALSQLWMILTPTPVLMGDLLCIILFIWAELCVISHYQNIRDGVHEDTGEATLFAPHARNLNTPNTCEEAPEMAIFSQMQPNSVALPLLDRNWSLDSNCSANDPPPPYPGALSSPSPQSSSSAATSAAAAATNAPPPKYEECVVPTEKSNSD